VQGERELVSDCRSLARFELRGIPPMTAGAARIRVTFTVDADGLLSVAAREMGSGIEAAITVKPSYGLSDDDIARMLQESFGAAGHDLEARALREQQVEAQRLLEATQAALVSDGDLLDVAERAAVEKLLADVSAHLPGSDLATLRSATEALVSGTDEFASRRMDRSIRAALAGRSVEELAR
jgi:molecular chaperone HscA